MAYQITFESHSDYIHATVTGTNSGEVVVQYMHEVLQECTRQNCFRILIEEILVGPRLKPMEIFAVMSEGSMKALGKFDAIAFVDESMGDMAEFAENVGVNRGIPVAMFNDVVSARKWLSRQGPDSPGNEIFRQRNDID